MLGFFRRYQKSFMLIFLTPALLAMGITGAILSVVQGQGEQIAGTIHGQPITRTDFDNRRRLYKQITNPRAEDEDAWRFLVLLSEAEQAGLTISEDELRNYLRSNTRIIRARHKAVQIVKDKGIDIDDPRFNREWQNAFLDLARKNVQNDDPDADFDLDEYKKAIMAEFGVTHRQYEAHMRREALVQKFLDTIRQVGVVDPSDIKEAYQDKHHLRTAELVEVPASRYAPKVDAKEGEPGHVTEEQQLEYYREHELEFDEPRRVDMQFLALRFDDVSEELSVPSDEALASFNKGHGIAPVTTDALGFKEGDREAITDAWKSWEARLQAQDAMDQVADALEKHDKAQAALPEDKRKPIDLKTIRVSHKLGSLISTGETGLITLADLAKESDDVLEDRSFLDGRASERWFKVEKKDSVSEVLGSLSGLFVLRTKDLKEARTPRFEDIKQKVLECYVHGTEIEQRRNYENFRTTKYKQGESWDVDVAFYMDDHPKLGDHAKAKEAVEKAKSTAEQKAREKQGAWKAGRKFDWYLLGTDPAFDPGMTTEDRLDDATKEDLEKHAKVGKAAGSISTSRLYDLHVVEFDKGWALYRVVGKNALKAQPFDKVKDKVKENINLARGLQRAEQAAEEELLAKLRHKSGEELKAALKELGLESRTTEPFNQETVTLEGIPEAGRVVSETFLGEVGGGFTTYVADPVKDRLFLLRVASRQDAPAAGFADAYTQLREEMLVKARQEFGEEHIRSLILDAKGISQEHMDYARSVRDGPGGITKLELRQIYLPPDRKIIGDWLDNAAKTTAQKIQKDLAGGAPWQTTVDRLSEHAATSGRSGELPSSDRAGLGQIFGNEFAEGAWNLKQGEAPRLVKSDLGYHLVRVVKEDAGRKTFQHLLIRTDEEKRELPAEVRKKAEDAAKQSLDKALAALQAGQPFEKVAEDYGDAEDVYGQGNGFEVDFVTPLERAALGQTLEWDADIAADGDEEWVPEAVQVQGPDGSTHWHLFACTRVRGDTEPVSAENPRRDRKVFHVRGATKGDVEKARADMLEIIREGIQGEEGGRPTWRDLEEKFQEVAADRSDAPDAEKGGALGVFRLQAPVRPYGEVFLQKVCYQDDGKPVTEGMRIPVFRGATGYHLVEVVKVHTAAADDSKRKIEVSEEVLAGTGWQ